MPVVFISYSHDSDAHRERVRGLHASLARDGCDCRLDVFKDTDEDWPSWMAAQLIEADFVLCVVTETYELRFRDRELPDQGLGVGWEAGLIRRLLYAKKLHNNRIFPVIFNKEDKKRIPLELQGYDFFHPDGQTGYETLLRKILNRPEHEKPATGTPPNLLTGTTPPLFVRPGEIAPASIPNDISRIVKYAPEKLIGREAETKLLDDAWLGTQSFQPAGIGKSPLGSEGAIGQDREPEASRTQTHIVTFVALGGEGKTSLVAKWAVELAAKNWPGCEAVFAWSFYSQGTREQNASSSDLFLAEALRFFGDEETAASAKGAYEKGQRLARLVGQRRALLILDGVEPLQHAPTSPMPGELKDQGLAALLKSLAATNRGLCVVTTRYSIPDLRAFLGKTVREEKLSRLSTSAGAALLKALGVKGSERKTIPASKPRWNEYEALVEDVQGHALTLNLLGTYLRDAHNGDIRQRDLIHLAEANSEELGGHAFRVMDAYVDWLASAEPETLNTSRRALALWQLMGLFDRPATADCLQALWQAPAIEGLTEPLIGLTEAQRNVALKRLEDARLLTVNRDAAGRLLSLDAHPLVREYFAERVRSSAFRRQRLGTSRRRLTAAQPPKGGTTNMWREAHRRIYEHLCETTKEGETPTLEELQPLYQAVAHGCLAGLQQEARETVYRNRIPRGASNQGGFYSTKKLGAFGSDLGAVACFFEVPWSRVSPALTEADQAWLLAVAAFNLRALGRLTESLEPMRAGLEMRVKQEVWKGAAIIASNLSELELTLGLVDAAVRDAEQSVEYADRSGDAFTRLLNRTTHADALHQAGCRAEAEAQFRAAEQIQAERQPEYPLLYSLRGFQYCDLLLTRAEQAAAGIFDDGFLILDLIAECRAVAERAKKNLKYYESGNWASLLTINLEHLTLGRAALYATILEQSKIQNSKSNIEEHSEIQNSKPNIENSVNGLRRAGQQHHLPRGLLTRAWLRALTGALTGPDSAQKDLDEAWEIAERGSMKLFLADIHLYRARLFGLRIADFGFRIAE